MRWPALPTLAPATTGTMPINTALCPAGTTELPVKEVGDYAMPTVQRVIGDRSLGGRAGDAGL